MYYNKFKDLELSGLGFGCMRLPVIDGDDSRPDVDAVQEMVDYAMANGINYYDTAWGYHGGNSESVMGKVLSKYDHKDFYIASKFPGYDRDNYARKEEIFQKQLDNCQVDYFDFYLFHCVEDKNIDMYLDDELGLADYLASEKEAGRIKNLGFSCHGSFETMHRFIKKYWRIIDFCQIQLNYLDFEYQNAKLKVEELDNLNIPIWVMEGLRGGKLAQSCLGAEKILAKSNPEWTPANWAFGFLESIPGVTMILSGMSNMEQLQQNVEFFSEKKTISDEDMGALFTAAHFEVTGTKAGTIPCTACRYCTSKCPQELDIPRIIDLYNQHIAMDENISAVTRDTFAADKLPTACIGCGSCAAVCPQRIDIPDIMKMYSKMLED